MQAIIFFTLAISAMVFVIYLGARSTMRGMKAKSERLTEEEELKNSNKIYKIGKFLAIFLLAGSCLSHYLQALRIQLFHRHHF